MELIDGREIQKPLPKKLHFLIQRYLLIALDGRVGKQYLAGPELNVLCGSDRLVPDVVVVRKTAEYRKGDLAEPAVLAVEIVPPGQTVSDLLDKCGPLLKAATSMCWIIWPERRKAWMYTSDDLIQAQDLLLADLPESSPVAVNVAEMWAELD